MDHLSNLFRPEGLAANAFAPQSKTPTTTTAPSTTRQPPPTTTTRTSTTQSSEAGTQPQPASPQQIDPGYSMGPNAPAASSAPPATAPGSYPTAPSNYDTGPAAYQASPPAYSNAPPSTYPTAPASSPYPPSTYPAYPAAASTSTPSSTLRPVYQGCSSRLNKDHGTYSVYCPVGWQPTQQVPVNATAQNFWSLVQSAAQAASTSTPAASGSGVNPYGSMTSMAFGPQGLGDAPTVTPAPPANQTKVADLPTEPPEAPANGATESDWKFWKQWWFWAAVGVVVVGGTVGVIWYRRKKAHGGFGDDASDFDDDDLDDDESGDDDAAYDDNAVAGQ